MWAAIFPKVFYDSSWRERLDSAVEDNKGVIERKMGYVSPYFIAQERGKSRYRKRHGARKYWTRAGPSGVGTGGFGM